jgi:hypothetical protein
MFKINLPFFGSGSSFSVILVQIDPFPLPGTGWKSVTAATFHPGQAGNLNSDAAGCQPEIAAAASIPKTSLTIRTGLTGGGPSLPR